MSMKRSAATAQGTQSVMPAPNTSFDDLSHDHAVLRAYVAHFATSPVITLHGLWDVAGRKPENDPSAWLERRGENLGGEAVMMRGHVIADADAAWRYLLDTEPAILAAAIVEAERSIAADPIQAAVPHPDVMSVTIARSHLVNALGMTDAEACRHLMDGALARTAELAEHERESIIAKLQRAIHAIVPNTDGRLWLRDLSGTPG